MRPSCTAVLVLSIASLIAGCQQAPNASSPLTPIGAMAPAPQLAPVSGTTGIGAFGSPTRIPPPATGSYAVPNNYMGGTTAIGEVGLNSRGVDSFRGMSDVRAAGFADSPGSGGVAATSFGTGFNAESAGNPPPPSPMQPQLGGMRVHDLTGAPLPPGYRGEAVYRGETGFRTEAPAVAIPNLQQPGQAAGGFAPTPNPNFQNQPINSAPRIQIPNRIPGADIASGGDTQQQTYSIAQLPGDPGPSREVPIRPSPLQPSFHGAAQFQTQPPSTDPVNKGVPNQPSDLPWRRPAAAY